MRILLANGQALTTLVWAEDGLFPLCVRAHGPVACATDPFSGYLLLLPRLVAWPVSLVPIDQWPLATNLAAAVLAGTAAVLAVLVLRAAGTGVVASGLVALLPVVAPIMGFEAINATGSSYMLLVFVAALAVCFPPQGRFPTWAYRHRCRRRRPDDPLVRAAAPAPGRPAVPRAHPAARWACRRRAPGGRTGRAGVRRRHGRQPAKDGLEPRRGPQLG